MVQSLEGLLSSMEYPGRFLVIGLDSIEESNIVIYGITGRSESSQARRLDKDELNETKARIYVNVTDEEQLRKGFHDLLVYDTMKIGPNGIVVSNGKQTKEIDLTLNMGTTAVPAIVQGSSSYDYEPDGPNFTPRISGVITPKDAAIGIIRRKMSGEAKRTFFPLELKPGEGHFIATYTGENRDPLPSFQGNPILVALGDTTLTIDIANRVYGALGPLDSNPDLRVSVAAVHQIRSTGRYNIRFANRHGD